MPRLSEEITKWASSLPYWEQAALEKIYLGSDLGGEEYDESVDNTINVHVKRLRNKIEVNPKKPDIIATVYAFGYRLGQEVVELLKKEKENTE